MLSISPKELNLRLFITKALYSMALYLVFQKIIIVTKYYNVLMKPQIFNSLIYFLLLLTLDQFHTLPFVIFLLHILSHVMLVCLFIRHHKHGYYPLLLQLFCFCQSIIMTGILCSCSCLVPYVSSFIFINYPTTYI